jgi:hypothetical protein
MKYLVRRSRRNLNHKKKSGERYRNRSLRQRGGIKEMRKIYNVYFNYYYFNNPDEDDFTQNILTRQLNPRELVYAWEHFTECRSIEMDDNPQLEDIILDGLTQLEQPIDNKHFNIQIYTVNKNNEESLELIHKLMELAGQDYIDFTRYGSSTDSNHYYNDNDDEEYHIVEANMRGGFPKLEKRFYVY